MQIRVKMAVWKRLLLVLLAFLACVNVITVLYHNDWLGVLSTTSFEYSSWPEFDDNPLGSHAKYSSVCTNFELSPSIEKLPENIKQWQQTENMKCKEILKKMMAMYEVREEKSEVFLSKEFENVVSKWLKDDPDLMSRFRQQVVIQVTNIYSQEQSMYNPLRAKRPQKQGAEDPQAYVNRMDRITRKSCDFCKPETFTATDKLGRMKSRYSYAVGNAFKLDRWHALFISKEHKPVNLTRDHVVDLFSLSMRWFKKVNKYEPEYSYPHIVWDVLYKAGASQFHTHTQGLLGSHKYYQEQENPRRGAERYFKDMGTNFFTDLVAVHDVLGLTLHYKDAVALAPLTARKDYEFIILSRNPNISTWELMWFVLKMYWSIGKVCHSMGVAIPELGEEKPKKGKLPTFIRMGTRGDCTSPYNDASSLDLYMAPQISADPYKSIELLENTIRVNVAS